MAIKLKARETMIKIGKYAGTYRYVLSPELYTKLAEQKVIQEAALRSGLTAATIKAAYDSVGLVLAAWATEGLVVPIPGCGSMRFGVKASSVSNVEKVSANLITARKVIFTPAMAIKNQLKATSVSIACYDRNGKLVKTVNSRGDDQGDFEVELISSPEEGGTFEGAGFYNDGESAVIKAIPAEGYQFVKWDDDEVDAERTIIVTDDVCHVATFKKVGESSGSNGSASGSGSQNTGGQQGGSNTQQNGSSTDSGTSGTGGSTSGTPGVEQVKLSTYKNPSLGGTVTPGGTYDKGTQVTIEAIPAETYLFDMWSDHVTDNPRTITLTANKSVTAWFYKEGEQKPSEMEDGETQI